MSAKKKSHLQGVEVLASPCAVRPRRRNSGGWLGTPWARLTCPARPLFAVAQSLEASSGAWRGAVDRVSPHPSTSRCVRLP